MTINSEHYLGYLSANASAVSRHSEPLGERIQLMHKSMSEKLCLKSFKNFSIIREDKLKSWIASQNSSPANAVPASHKRYSIVCSAESLPREAALAMTKTAYLCSKPFSHSEQSEESISRILLTNKDSLLTSFPQNDGKRAAFTLAEVFTPHPTCQRKCAFTLAEVLITLGIIGVVAAMTMPALIAGHRDKEIVVKLKKVYSVYSQAFARAVDEYGTPDYWDLDAESSQIGADNMMKIFNQFIQKAKECNAGEQGCWYGGSALNHRAYSILADGSNVYYQVINPNCTSRRGNSKALENVCAAIGVDINGNNPPNRNGNDIFQFYVTKDAVVPYGTQDELQYTFDRSCFYDMSNNNYGCTAWVIFNENRDYLKCKDILSWDGQKSCK